MRVALYYSNKGLGKVDLSSFLQANPGIGGTEYVVLLVAWLLKEEYEITLYANEPIIGIDDLKTIIVDDVKDAVRKAEEDQDVLIVKYSVSDYLEDSLHCQSVRLSIVVWVHLFANRLDLDYYYRNPNVKRIVFVGREHRDLYIDHPSINKSCYIFNTLNTSEEFYQLIKNYPYHRRKPIVTYMGFLSCEKGFHHLAAIWKDIIKEVPDAELYVIGSGQVYNRTNKMGSYGITADYYEKWFMPYITDEDGHVLPSVHFMGHMGAEKKEILLKTKVGVPNPKGLSETFCITAVEMQLFGATVAACRAPGYYDTFINGVITNNMEELKNCIIRLLKDNEPIKPYNVTIKEIEKRFSFDVVKGEWIRLLNEIDGSTTLPHNIHNLRYRWKWLKYSLYKIKCCCPLLWRIIPVESVIQKFESWRNIRNL